ncbi:peptidoglycan DD-metalloendopeptidase family protein [Flavisericum labens]|uniref:peptidoglycan DD-metalloendopeptidase family protein n=1 Tax=Flavisericum labens TaxID=3377112 RepID=UPI00387B3F1D
MQPNEFSEFLNGISDKPLNLLNPSIPKEEYIPIDLSEANLSRHSINVTSTSKFSAFINQYLQARQATVAYGGYLETRNIYKRSTYFNSGNSEARDIHLGIDFWCEAETRVYSPLEGKVHSFKNNASLGDYGPTIILKHQIEALEFYTLYGHLSLESIINLKIGESVKHGDAIGTLGDTDVNGDYPPHLHFQIIKDLQGRQGDYSGVCSKTDFHFYKQNCPDPNLLLKL